MLDAETLMELLQLLGVALGLASLAGINLYLTVFVTGLAIRLGWVTLSAPYQDLAVLGHPVLIGIAGFLYFVEFFADKVPWVDSIWDAVHTVVRPVGAAALALAALGELHPVVEIAAVLIAGGLGLTTHMAKAGTRLAANTSPEPFSNIGLSLAEDGVVLGGLGLIAWNPVVALVAVILTAAVILMLLPRLLRASRAKVWLAWKKLNSPPEESKPVAPGGHLPSDCLDILRRSHAGTSPVAWAARCLTGGCPRVPASVFGWLVALEGEPGVVFFVSHKLSGGNLVEIALPGATIEVVSGFLAAKITLEHPRGSHSFLFDRGSSRIATAIADDLRHRSAQVAVGSAVSSA